MKITLPKTKSSHLPNCELWIRSSELSSVILNIKSRCGWKGCFKYQQTGIWHWFPTCRRTPGAQVPLLLATLQSRVILQWSSWWWRAKSLNTPGILVLFHVIVFLAVWKISFNDLFKTIGYKLTCCFLDQGKGLIVTNPTKGEDHDFQTFWDQVSGISLSSFPGKQYGRLVLECSIVDHFSTL